MMEKMDGRDASSAARSCRDLKMEYPAAPDGKKTVFIQTPFTVAISQRFSSFDKCKQVKGCQCFGVQVSYLNM